MSTQHGTAANGWSPWRPAVFGSDRFSGSARVCPTCHGTGKVPKGYDDELVALIPYSDKRLKPQRKWLIVCICVFVLVIILGIAATIMTILFPRHLDIKLSTVNSTHIWDLENDTGDVIMEVKTLVNTVNDNFGALYVSKFEVSLSSIDNDVGTINLPPFTLDPRKETVVLVLQNATFSEGLAWRVRLICTNKDFDYHKIYMQFTVAVSYSYLSQEYDSFLSNGTYVDCG